MDHLETCACSICGEEKIEPSGWYVLIENVWLDRLQVLHWGEHLAKQVGTHSLCSPRHVQELVAHWMVTGSLSYPFAYTGRERGNDKWSFPIARENNTVSREEMAGNLIGELAVHRESLERVLDENPHALSTILEALLEAMQPHSTAIDAGASEKNEEEEELVTV